jgi:Glycoside hydrolase 123, catalytic domain
MATIRFASDTWCVGRRLPPLLAIATALVAAVAASAGTLATRDVSVRAYPSATTIHPSGVPAGGASSASLVAANGEQEDTILLVRGAHTVSLAAPSSIGPLPLRVYFAHYVSFGGRLVPDALLPWDGSPRAAEHENQPVWLQVSVPYGTPAGTYSADLGVSADGAAAVPVKVSVRVSSFALPRPGQVSGGLMTAFNLGAETYGNTVGKLHGFRFSEQYHEVNPTLYRFLASYRISPTRWGYGDPTSSRGYTTDHSWFRSPLTNMQEEAGPSDIAPMALPLSNNRTTQHDWIGGMSPYRPETWCDYLRSVHDVWQANGWLAQLPYLFSYDEGGNAHMRLIQRQAATLHACFPGGQELITGHPTPSNRFLWNGGNDDVDIWTVLANRYYGKYTVPLLTRRGVSRARTEYNRIQQVRARGRTIWAYNYAGNDTPDFTATEPLSDSSMLFLWAALENIRGVLYGENLTQYQGDPFQSVSQQGAYVLIYPGVHSPMPSARLEQIRDGIEEWEILYAVRMRYGAARVRTILGGAGLFSADARGVKLGCTIGCALHTSTPFAWPAWSHDRSTPDRLQRAKLAMLNALG